MKKELCNAFGAVFLTIEYDVVNKWIYNNWIGYQTPENIISGGTSYLEILEETKCPYLLNDNRKVIGPWDHAIDWIAKDLAPRAIVAGLTHLAHIACPDSLAAKSVKKMKKEISAILQMHIQIFESLDEAQEWLREAQGYPILK